MIYEYVRDLVNRPSLSSDQECKDNQRYAKTILFVVFLHIFVDICWIFWMSDVS